MRAVLLWLTILLVLSAAGGADEFDWLMVNGCRERTSWARDEDTLYPPFAYVTDYDQRGDLVTVSRNMLFASYADTANIVVAYDTETRTKLWSFVLPNTWGSAASVPAVGESLVFCGSHHGFGLHALDRFTGQERWLKQIGNLYTRNPIVDGGRAYVVQDSLYCLDGSTGATVWSYPVSGQLTPAVDDSNAYVATGSQTIAFDKATGTVKWQTASSQRLTIALALGDDYVYAYESGLIAARSKASGDTVWTHVPPYDLPWLTQGAMAVSDDYLCYAVWEDADTLGRIYTLDSSTGAYLWHHVLDTAGAFAPTIANGFVYAVNHASGTLWGFNLATGGVAFFDDALQYRNQPVVANHALWVSSSSGIREFRTCFSADDRGSPNPNLSVRMLAPSQPNPAVDRAFIHYRLPCSGHLRLRLLDVTGRVISILAEGYCESGSYRTTLDATGLPPGAYVCRLDAAALSESRPLVIVR